MNFKLTPEEQEIEDHAEEFESVTGDEREEIETIIGEARRSRQVNLRMSEFDLALVKKRAEAEGIPYQTLINQIVHKYVTDQMYDREELRKLLAEMRDIQAI